MDLDDELNQFDIPHSGNHAQEYHQLMNHLVTDIAKDAKNEGEFLNAFEVVMRRLVERKPWIVQNDWWKQISK